MRKYEFKPWGSFINIFDAKYTKVKQIVIKPGESPSYQYHHKRAEAWVVVQGIATVTLNDKEFTYKECEIVDIEVGMKHRVHNEWDTDLIFIETQTGSYFGEDDIVRLEDDYGRIEDED